MTCPPSTDASAQASLWFALMQDSPTPAQREELANWLAADPEHARAYARLESLWAASAVLLKPPAPVLQPQLSRRRFVGMGVGMGIAASAVAVTAGSTALWFKGIGSPFADLRTAVGERRQVTLADGSSVELAGNSALNLDFSAGRRTLKLLQGEAYFNVVAQASGEELKVVTPAGQVLAGEGEFCVSCTATHTTLTVVRHRARVVSASQRTDLEAGQSLRFSASQAEPIQHAEPEQVLAWRSGRLVFFNRPLQSVVDELQRWREGRIFIMDPRLAERRVSLILNLERPEQMLDVLSRALSIRTARYTDLVTLIYPA